MTHDDREVVEKLERLVGHLTAILDRLESADKSELRYLTVAEAAKAFKLSPQFFYKNRAFLVKAGRAVRVDVVKLQRYLDRENT